MFVNVFTKMQYHTRALERSISPVIFKPFTPKVSQF